MRSRRRSRRWDFEKRRQIFRRFKVVKKGKYKGSHWETRREILGKLKMRGALPSSTMAEELGISSMAVRQHLQDLQNKGDVLSSDVSRGKGRPTKYWELTDHASRHFTDSHRDLILDLIENMKDSLGPESMDRLLEKRGEGQIETYKARVHPLTSLLAKVEGLARIRSEEGYMAEVQVDGDDTCYLIENHCPICAAAESCAGLCATELEVFRKTLGDEVKVERTEHLLNGSRRCVYRIRPSL